MEMYGKIFHIQLPMGRLYLSIQKILIGLT